MTITQIKTTQQFDSIASSARAAGHALAILFTASWHPPCAQVLQVLEELSNEHRGTVVLVSAEAESEALATIAEKYGVESVPTLYIFKDGDKDKVETVIQGANVSKIVSEITRIAKRSEVVGAGLALGATEEKVQLEAKLQRLIQAAPVMLFMKGEPSAPKCKFSRAIIELLGQDKFSSAGLKFGYFDILTDDAVREGLKVFSNWKTYPQLYVRGKLIGGLDIVKEMDEMGELETLLLETVSSSRREEEDLNTRLTKLVKQAPVMLFMKGEPAAPKCGFSRSIIDILRKHQIKFDHFDILLDEGVRQGLKAFSNWKTYPQLYVNGELIGGLDIVRELEESGEFARMIPEGSRVI